MTDVMTTKKPKKQKAAYPFPVELIDQLLAQVENKDAESILGESGLAGQLKKAVYPRAQIQTCIVHLIRNSTTLASWKDREEQAASLKPVYQAANADLAAIALDQFAEGPWGTKFPKRSGNVATPVEAGDSVLRVSPGSAHHHLHDQCH